MARVISTVGHSNLSLDDLFARLRPHGVRRLADVRAIPASRRHPHFARDALARACGERDIEYHWLPGLGGRRKSRAGDSPHLAWEEPGFRSFADYMDTDEFLCARRELERFASAATTAFLCAEVLWWRCHRRLIADSLLVAGWDVEHIGGDSALQAHRLPAFARLDGSRIVYDRGVTPPLAGVGEPRRGG